MINLIKGIFSSNAIVENGSKALDALHFSAEEHADIRIKFAVATLPSNVSRRIIAVSVCFMWVVCGISSLGCIFFSHEKSVEIIQFSATYVAIPFGVIVSWYFWKGKKDDQMDSYAKKIQGGND